MAQIRFPLCMHSDQKKWSAGLNQASELIHTLLQAVNFEARDVYDIFNDKLHFTRRQRHELLYNVLREAPREVVLEVLTIIDQQDVVLEEHTDEEIQLLMELVISLDEDVRLYSKAYSQMVREWLIGSFHRHHGGDGVVSIQRLSPEQICDHIEDDV